MLGFTQVSGEKLRHREVVALAQQALYITVFQGRLNEADIQVVLGQMYRHTRDLSLSL